MSDTMTEEKHRMTSPEVRQTLVDALRLDLVGPWVGHELAEEKFPGWKRPSNWYLTGFLIPAGTPPEASGDADEDDEEVAESLRGDAPRGNSAGNLLGGSALAG